MGVEREDSSLLITIFQENYEQLIRFLTRRLGGDRDRATDVAQDTYLRLQAQSGSDIAAIGNPRAYVYRVAGNLAIDGLRRDGRIGKRLVAEMEGAEVEAPDPSPEKTVIGRQRLALLDQALTELPEKPRRALMMFRIDGLSQAEIARELGVSESMVAKYIARALRHCRDCLWRAEAK